MIEKSNIAHSPALQDNEETLVKVCEPIYDEVFSYRNLFISAKKCVQGVAWKASVQMFVVNRLQWIAFLYNQLQERSYKSRGFIKFHISERGKTRFIQSVHISERCVQKTLNNYGLKPLIEPKLIYDNGASREGKGSQFAIERLRQHLATHYRKYRTQGGILTLDLHDYFNSISHDLLKRMLRIAIEDDELYRQTIYFIDCFDGDVGIGLGSEISQICAIYYPSLLDHYIKEKLHIKGYGRYMDDMYLIHYDIDYLKECKKKIEDILLNFGLTLNPKTTITKFDKGSFVYLKRRFKFGKNGKIVTRLLRKNITARRRKLKRQKRALQNGKANIKSIHQSYQAWRGYALKWDSRKTVRTMDKIYYDLFHKEDRDVEKFYRSCNSQSIKRMSQDDTRSDEDT